MAAEIENCENGEKNTPPWFFWSFAVLSFLLFLGSSSLWPTESRFAEAAREMLESETLLKITLNGQPVAWRPVGGYYAMLLSGWALGLLDELAVRLPSVLSALLTLWAVKRLGARLFGRESGACGAWLLLGCGGFLFLGRTGGADMANTAAIMLGLAWFYARRKHPDFPAYLLFYLVILGGSLFKGLPAVMPVFVLMLPGLLRDGIWKKQLRFSHLAALILALAFYLTPQYLLFLGTPEEFVRQILFGNNLSKFHAPGGGESVLGSYALELPMLLLPWTLLILIPLFGLISRFHRIDSAAKDLLVGAALLLALLALLVAHNRSYLLTALPVLAVLAGYALTSENGEPSWNDVMIRLMRFLVVVAASMAVVSLIVMPFWRGILGFSLPWQMPVTVVFLGVLALWVLLADEFSRRRTLENLTGVKGRLAALLLAGNILSCGFLAALQLQYYSPATSREFLIEMGEQLGQIAPENLVYWGDTPSLRLLFYMKSRTPMKCADSPESLRRALAERSGRLVLLASTKPEKRRTLEDALKKCGVELDLDRPAYQEKRRPFEPETKDKLVVYFWDGGPGKR